jgi:hypothetical protein
MFSFKLILKGKLPINFPLKWNKYNINKVHPSSNEEISEQQIG